ncbi:hypothetical protein Poli38472_008704 [Pythium oligandrum]|uniref:non-specific serine/threonine protein kinase n=1 Tax=Pythium oligandrum TaxID=41045 RepID=A0A8K1FBF1_PYTOL|nr:hypothetical protein Poli38472_008704 [Pythium oligandrum]|eukprot:TMW56056.1 hypothetical protein Poli38472_008704 [Pythium oligandrum]
MNDIVMEDVTQPPVSEKERKARIINGVQELTQVYRANGGQNYFKPHEVHLNDDLRFTVQEPRDYFSTKVAEEEETKSDESDSQRLVAGFFDPVQHTPSNQVVRPTKTGIVKFAYHFATKAGKSPGEIKTSIHPTAFKVMDRERLQHCGEDTQRERRVMMALRREGFRKPRQNPLVEPAYADVRKHTYDYFPQWRFYEDESNQYMMTDFASNGSLVQYTKKRIDSYNVEIAHLMSTYVILSGFPVTTAVTKLWRQEALCIFSGIVEAVAYMHAKGVCHLDLDVYNIVIDAMKHPIIVDFGSSEVAAVDGSVGRGRPILCKHNFGAPEVVAHNRNVERSPGVDGRAADMYSLGAILYWLLFIYPGESPIVDPMKNDPRWLQHLIHHLAPGSGVHEGGNCAICRSLVPLETDVVQLFQALLTNLAQRITITSLLDIIRGRDYQVHGDTITRSQAVFEELRKSMHGGS